MLLVCAFNQNFNALVNYSSPCRRGLPQSFLIISVPPLFWLTVWVFHIIWSETGTYFLIFYGVILRGPIKGSPLVFDWAERLFNYFYLDIGFCLAGAWGFASFGLPKHQRSSQEGTGNTEHNTLQPLCSHESGFLMQSLKWSYGRRHFCICVLQHTC
jgi:hypothetical protein